MKDLFLTIILFCGFLINCFALAGNNDEQQNQIDSLKGVIENDSIHDTTKVKAIFDLSYFFYLTNPDTTIILSEKALELSKKNNFNYGLSESYGWIGYLLQQQGKSEKALTYYFKNLKLANEIKDEKGIVVAANNIAHVYSKQGLIDKAIKFYNICISSYEKSNNTQGLATISLNVGALYDDQGQKEVAIDYYKKALKLSKEIDNKRMISFALNNLGFAYDDGNNDSLSLWYFRESIKLVEEIGDYQAQGNTLANIAHILDRQGNKDEAMQYFQRALDMQKKINNTEGILRTNINLANIFNEQGQINKSMAIIKVCYNQSLELGYPRYISGSASLLGKIYEGKGNYKDALSMYKLYIKMRDSLNNESTQKAAIQQQAKYEYEKQKAIDDAEHEKEIAIEQEAKEKQTILTYATGGGLGLVGIFLLIVFNRLKVTRKQKNIIEEQKQEVEKQKTVVELAHSELEEKNKEITDSIQYAKRIQNAILPPNKVVKEYLTESFILYKPKDIVAGDFYWLEAVSDEGGVMSDENPTLNTQHSTTVLFAAADCTGHGVPGAMVSVVCNNGLNRSVREYGLTDPGKILDKTREIVVEEFEKSEEEVKDGMDIALCSLEGTTLKYAGAHNPLWIIRKGELLETKANKQPIGKFDNPEPYTTHSIELQKGDSVYIFSDGYADQFGGEKGKKLKTANFKKLLLSIQTENMQKQKELIDEAFESWKGNIEQLDDVCVIGVKI